MHKLIPLGLIILILLSSIYLTNMEFAKNEAWSQYSTSRYVPVRLGKQDLLLIKSLQPDEYEVIIEKLLDSEKEPLSQQQLQQLKRDRNSYFPDNILPDGRYMKENHLELENQLYQEMTKPVVMGDESQVIEQFTVSLGNKATLVCDRIQLKEGFALRPVSEMNYRFFNYMISDNGSQTIVVLENGIWTIDAATMQVQRITEMNDDTYAALQAASFKRFGMNQVFANSLVTVNATLDRIAYMSNRDSFDEGTLDLYLVDAATGKETVFKADKEKNESFRPEKWLDDKSLLVYNMTLEKNELMVYTTDSDVIPLGMNAMLYDVSANRIAYYSGWDANVIHVVEFHGDKVIPVTDIALPNLIDVNSDFNKFSPDHSKIVCGYSVLDNNELKGFLLYDFESKKSKHEEILPDQNDYFEHLVWLNPDTIVFTLAKKGEKVDDVRAFSTWLYHVE